MLQLYTHVTIIELQWHLLLQLLQANGNVEIEEAESINKSYPNFYDHLQKLEQQFNIHNCKSVCLVE
jgi:hypothetical protein